MKLKILCDGKKVGETSLVKRENDYLVIGELFEPPILQCEKSFESKIKALWNLFWLKYERKNKYINFRDLLVRDW